MRILDLRILTCLQGKRHRLQGLIQSNVESTLTKISGQGSFTERSMASKDGGSGKTICLSTSILQVNINLVY